MNNFIPDINKLNNDKSIDNKEDNYFNSLTTETFSRKENNSDVINISELNKEKLEYERDDVKMNNGQFNNNLGQSESNQAPAFGGRFFPSLEDEPTNMNMMGGLNNGPSIPVTPATPEPMGIPTPPNMNNNLIDLTDLSVDNEPNSMAMPNFGTTPTMPSMPEPIGIPTSPVDINMSPVGGLGEKMPSMEQPMNIPTPNPMGVNDFNSAPNSVGEIPNIGMNPMPSLDNLQNNNPPVAPSTEPVSMDILNADFGAPQPIPSFGPSQAPRMPSMPEPMGIPTPPIDVNMPQSGGFGTTMAMPNMEQPMMDTSQSIPNFGAPPVMPPMTEPMGIPTPPVDVNIPQVGNLGEPMTIPNFNNNVSTPTVETNTISTKDVTPVTNAIKNLVNSLTEFGYKINITEDDLINVSKLTIEIEK